MPRRFGRRPKSLVIYHRVVRVTNGYDWVTPTAEETWHNHAEENLTVALQSMNIAAEAWQLAKLLQAIPSSKLSTMAAYHYVSPSLSTEKASLMDYWQKKNLRYDK